MSFERCLKEAAYGLAMAEKQYERACLEVEMAVIAYVIVHRDMDDVKIGPTLMGIMVQSGADVDALAKIARRAVERIRSIKGECKGKGEGDESPNEDGTSEGEGGQDTGGDTDSA